MTELRGMKLPPPRFRIAPLPESLRHVRGFHSLQTFFPALSKIYRLSKTQSEDVWLDSRWRLASLDISGTSGPCIVGLTANVDCSAQTVPTEHRKAYLKVTHLLDPVRWMKGQYSLPKHSGLPWHSRTWTTAWHKLQDSWNQAYVETIATYALGRLREEGASPHFNFFYGAFCARADTYRYNLTEDFSTMRKARWFWNGQRRGLYRLTVLNSAAPEEPVEEDILREVMQEPSESELDSDSSSEEEIDVDADETEKIEIGSMHSDEFDDVEYASESESSPEENSKTTATGDEDDDDALADYRVYSEFNDFPVMLIAVEENHGTMDALLDSPTEVGAEPGTAEWELRWSAWLFQVVAALSAAQSLIGFTHNDLHTNNIVWTPTTEEYLYYKTAAGAIFKVPTFGKLFRLIDFGRAIFTVNGHQFISDDFRIGNDAGGQYCFKPLHPRPEGREVPPNPSFDLCRLAVSLFEALFPDAPEDKEGGQVLSSEEGLEVMETVSPLYNMLWGWMIDDEGRNVLIEPDGEERFPGFDLYTHIAAKIHGAVPSEQLVRPTFDQFQIPAKDVVAGTHIWNLFC